MLNLTPMVDVLGLEGIRRLVVIRCCEFERVCARRVHLTYVVNVNKSQCFYFSPQHFVMSEMATMWCIVPWLCPNFGTVLFFKKKERVSYM